MEKLMTSAEFHLRDIQYRLTTLESLINHDSDSSKSQDSNQDPFTELLTYLTKGFSEIDGLAREIETRLFKEINATQTGKATLRLRLEQIKYDARHLRASLDHINAKRESKLRASKERQALLSTRFAPNSPSSSSTIDIAGENEYFGNEKSKLRQAGSGVDTLLEAGKHVMDGLRGQRERLGLTAKRLGLISSALGLSNSVMKIVERRTSQDKFILYGGMIVTSILIFIVLVYLR